MRHLVDGPGAPGAPAPRARLDPAGTGRRLRRRRRCSRNRAGLALTRSRLYPSLTISGQAHTRSAMHGTPAALLTGRDAPGRGNRNLNGASYPLTYVVARPAEQVQPMYFRSTFCPGERHGPAERRPSPSARAHRPLCEAGGAISGMGKGGNATEDGFARGCSTWPANTIGWQRRLPRRPTGPLTPPPRHRRARHTAAQAR